MKKLRTLNLNLHLETSLDNPISKEGGYGGTTMVDVFPNKQKDATQIYLEQTELPEILDKALNEREKKVIEQRFGLGDSKQLKLREIGKKLKINSEGVRMIEKRALKKLKKYYEKQ